MKLRAVVKQKSGQGYSRKYPLSDQCVYLRPGWRYTLGDLIEVKYGKYMVYTTIVGLGWEGDDFVVNVL